MANADIGLGNWFSRRTQQTPDRPALTFEGVTRSFAEMQAVIDRLAIALKAAGLCQGDRVAFLGFNQPVYFDLLFAAMRLGAIFVPLNFRLTGPELDYIINDAGVHTLVVDGPHRPIIDGIRDQLCCRLYPSADGPPNAWRATSCPPGWRSSMRCRAIRPAKCLNSNSAPTSSVRDQVQ